MAHLSPTELDQVLTQLADDGIIKRGKASIRLTTYGRELVKRIPKPENLGLDVAKAFARYPHHYNGERDDD